MRQVLIKTYAEASAAEREAFYRLVPEGGAMTEAAVRAGLPLAEALVICAEVGRIVGVAALKVPKAGYRLGLGGAEKAGFALPEAEFPRELGYVAVDGFARRQGICTLLCAEAMRLAAGRGLFATTGRDVMRDRILPRYGFVDAGASWQGRLEPVHLMVRRAG
jgi:GNAT superfamily N-acetyltransferase